MTRRCRHCGQQLVCPARHAPRHLHLARQNDRLRAERRRQTFVVTLAIVTFIVVIAALNGAIGALP